MYLSPSCSTLRQEMDTKPRGKRHPKNAFGNTTRISFNSPRTSTSGNSSILLLESKQPGSVCRSLPSPVNVTVNRISRHNHMTVVRTLYHEAEAHTVVVMHSGCQAMPYQVLIPAVRSITGGERLSESLIWLPLGA